MRLSGRRAFAAVFNTQMRRSSGPLLVYGKANGLEHARIGLSVSRKVGPAVRRNRIKRLIREAFRLNHRELPAGFDFVVVVRPHHPLHVADYADALSRATASLVRATDRGL